MLLIAGLAVLHRGLPKLLDQEALLVDIKLTLGGLEVMKGLHCTYSIFVFCQLSKNKFIQYLYLLKLLGINIYLIFIFGKRLDRDIFDIHVR